MSGSDRKPTVRDVARAAGVSVGTVSNVLNQCERVAPATRDRVLQAVKSLGYSRNYLARGLRRRQTNSLGLLLPTLVNPFYPALARGVEDEAHDSGYTVFVCSTDRQEERERALVQALLEKRVDGLIAVSPSRSVEGLLPSGQHIALVVVEGGRMSSATSDAVTVDAAPAIAAAAAHLQALGHRRLAFVGGPAGVPRADERWALWQRACAAHGMTWVPGGVYNGDFSFESGVAAGRHILAGAERPTAIVAANDLMVLGVIKAAAALGLSVPRDLSVVGFDDIPTATYVTPALSTIAVPTYQQGREAVRLLFGRVAAADAARRNTVLEAVFVARESTAAVPGGLGRQSL